MIKKITGLALISSVVLFACKKSSNDSSNNANAILGKWNAVRNVTGYYVAGVKLGEDTTTVNPSDYLDFDTNGKAYQYQNDGQEQRDTINYSIVNNFLIGGTPPNTDTLNIQKLDAHSLILTSSYTESGGGITTNVYDTLQFSK